MNYVISNSGVVIGAYAKRKEAEQELSAMSDEEKLTSAVYGKTQALLGLETSALVTIHNDFVDVESAITADDVTVPEELAKAVFALLEEIHNPKIADRAAKKAAAAAEREANPKERKPRASFVGRTISAGTKEISGRPGSWREFMLQSLLAAATTDAAVAAQAELPAHHSFYGKKLDIGWAASEGYIVLGDA